MRSDLGMQAVREIHTLWQADDWRTEWVEDGFDWWPGHLKVTVRVSPANAETGTDVYRLWVCTDMVRNVDVTRPHHDFELTMMNRFASSFAIVSQPRELLEEWGQDTARGSVCASSTAYLHEGIPWLPRFFGGMTAIQFAEAYRMSDHVASAVGGEVDTSLRPGMTAAPPPDDMLQIVDGNFIPDGQQPSRWAGTDEFREIIERWGKTEITFGTADESGLTLETSFGDDSALIRLFTNQPHPRLGNGLLLVVKFPLGGSMQDVAPDANWYNFFEARMWTTVPLLGAWTAAHSRGEEDERSPAFLCFVPNLVYDPGVAENLVLWSISRVRWLRQTRYPDLEDKPMYEVLKGRYPEAF